MRILFLILSITFAVYGLLPYHKATNIDTTKPNQLIINQQECGCPCPDARVIKGQLQIPQDIAIQYPTLHTTQLNLDIKDFNEPYNYELGQAKLFIKGKVVGADTILCEPTNCELAPRFQVDSWALVDTIARAWTFPSWVGLLFIINLFMFLPTLTITEIVKRIRQRK
jgi:hypothetical protein